jgi:hypothetical protein
MLDFKFLILNDEEMKMRLLLGRDLCPKGPFEEETKPRINANGREMGRGREARAEALRRGGG